ncbi:Hsp20/alpha crystallin family protein [Methanobacterium sp.]|uniref:Hsp20/alpha crystallin family protein n=1 Tax=Methanobacterium sp. TaxID=2164 RepID=UPI002ABC434A|nr:Hsp20/alpha crystallin family protein [Methanobacterium sp.]MDY9923193.1 Hsp20/alpha crystallin family protein [Methanobacterium sp.]
MVDKKELEKKVDDIKSDVSDKKDDAMDKKDEMQEEMGKRVDDIKSDVSDKKDDVSDSISEMKDDAMDKKDEMQEEMGKRVDDIKSDVSDKKDDVSDSISEMKDDAMDKKDEIQEEMGKRKTQADKLLKELVNTIKVKQVEVGKTLSDYTSLQKPLADIIETNDSLIIKIDLPGVTKEDIDIGIAGESIDVTVKFEEESEEEDINYIQKERSYGETKRTLKLPSEIKVKESSANFKDSVLTIKLPKIEKRLHKIDIN